MLVFDFEGGTYGDWQVEGEAFGPGPARGTLPGRMEVTGFLGQGLANSYHSGDGSTGTLTSPPFIIERKYVNFLIGGGRKPGEACLSLLIDGEGVRAASGPNDRPGGSEHLDWQQWDVTELTGKTATIQVVDQATGGWGHLNVDHIIQTDRRLPVLIDLSRELTVEKRYLNLPVIDGAAKRRMRYEPGKHWVMAVYDEVDEGRYIAFHTSPDLKQWEFQSRIEGYYECPEIFELPVDGDATRTKWVVHAANGEYALGAFDGKTFTTESGKHRFNYGNCFYASQTFSNIPPEDGRRIQIAWGQSATPACPSTR